MKKLLFIIAAFALPALACAEIKAGWAFLAAEHKGFPAKKCSEYARADNNPFIAVLADSFGKSRKCQRGFMKASKGKPTTWQYYAGNGSGRRKKLYPYEFLHRLSKDEYNRRLCGGHRGTKNQIIKQARRLRKRCHKYAHKSVTCLLSPELESQFTECAIKKWVSYAEQAGWKKKNIVHNPVNVGPYQGRGGAGYLERHWVFNKPAERDYHLGVDGACADHCGPCGITGRRVTDNEIVQWYSTYENRNDQILSLWCPAHQGLFIDSGQAGEPRRRNIRVSDSSFNRGNSLLGIGEPRPPAGDHNLKACDRVKEFSGCNICKESDHGGYVAVLENKLSNARLVAPKGRKWSLRYTGTANPCNGKDRHHYRHPQEYYKFPDNMVLKGKRNGKTECFKLYEAGRRLP